MRHGNINRKFGREHKHRMAMLRNQVTSLLTHERITTTVLKAKEIRGLAEKVITLGKRGDIHARRVAFHTVRDREVLQKVFGPLAERFKTRPGGYTRILKIGPRHGDMAPMSIIELLPDPAGAVPVKAETPAPAAKKTRAKAPAAESTDTPVEKKAAKKTTAKKAPKAEGEEVKAKPKAKKKG